jgi:hypothetical protein
MLAALRTVMLVVLVRVLSYEDGLLLYKRGGFLLWESFIHRRNVVQVQMNYGQHFSPRYAPLGIRVMPWVI